MKDNTETTRESECRCIENECPQCRNNITAAYVPGCSFDNEITGQICIECRNKNCWTDYWEDDRSMQMSLQEAMDTYDENQKRARCKRDHHEWRD